MSLRRVSTQAPVSVDIVATPLHFEIRVRVSTARMTLSSSELYVSAEGENGYPILTELVHTQDELRELKTASLDLPGPPAYPQGLGGGLSLSEDDRYVLNLYFKGLNDHKLRVKEATAARNIALSECQKQIAFLSGEVRCFPATKALLSGLITLTRIDRVDDRFFVLYRDQLWASLLGYSTIEWTGLIEQSLAREKNRVKYAFGVSSELRIRTAIPTSVRRAVWTRDSGKCVRCSSREKLEFDHIIPISRGGSTTERNLELLCETCNRVKSDDLGL